MPAYSLIIVAGTNGFLPLFSNTELGRSHSLFAPLAALLDMVVYLSAAIVIVLAGFDIYENFAASEKLNNEEIELENQGGDATIC